VGIRGAVRGLIGTLAAIIETQAEHAAGTKAAASKHFTVKH
jgi:hypothetical protein